MTAGNVYRRFKPRDRDWARVALAELIEINSNEAYYNLDPDSTPKIERIDTSTDPALRVAWAAGNTDPVQFSVALPADFDGTKDVTVAIRAASAGATDTPTFGLSSVFNESDTAVSDTSEATSSSYAWVEATIANADIPASAGVLNVTLTPGAHTTDALYMTAIRVKIWRDRS